MVKIVKGLIGGGGGVVGGCWRFTAAEAAWEWVTGGMSGHKQVKGMIILSRPFPDKAVGI